MTKLEAYWDRPFGDAGDAIDFACGHCAPDEAVAFLEDWRSVPHGNLAEAWPGYMRWLKVQHDGAREAAAMRSATPQAELRFEHPVGDTLAEWRENVRKTDLYQRGDTVLIWVNEADICCPPYPALAPQVAAPACEHEWVIPRFGVEDERECRKCRVTGEEVTRAAERLASKGADEDALRALISPESIEAIAKDIAIACVDCRPEIVEARHRAMVRLGERLRDPLDSDLRRAALPVPQPGDAS